MQYRIISKEYTPKYGEKQKIIAILLVICFLICFFLSAILRTPYQSEGFSMSDATYHVLLTMQAYDETPSSVHHWLPLQTYDGEFNKFINNGPSLLQDKFGNNYYVSFSPIGFYLPYFFCKLFHLPLNINSLYLFNCLLMFLSALLLGILIYLIFKDVVCGIFAASIYIFLPEVLYSQGIVYWHHSLSQVFLFSQAILFVLLFIERNNQRKIIKQLLLFVAFYAMSFLYPYSEWTGFISNIGFALGILIFDLCIENDKDKKNKRLSISLRAIGNIIGLAATTLFSAVYYVWRFKAVATVKDILDTMNSRMNARSQSGIVKLIFGYIDSFMPLLIVIVVCLIISIIFKESRKKIKNSLFSKKSWILFLVFSFPLMENLLLKEHALTYTFDRLKCVLVLVFILFGLLSAIKEKKYVIYQSVKIFVLITISLYGIVTYGNGKIIDLVEYNDSILLRDYLLDNYVGHGKNIIVKEGFRAWGYLQTMYHRNIYCTYIYTETQLKYEALSSGSDYIVYVESTSGKNDTLCYTKAKIFDLQTENEIYLSVNNHQVVVE